MTIADGAWIFIAAFTLLLASGIFGLYTRTGSGINGHGGGDPSRQGNEGLGHITAARGTR